MYSDAVLGLTALLSVAIVALLGLVLWKGKGSSDESEQPERRRAPRVLPQANDGEAVGRRVGNRRVAARRNVRAQEEVDDEDDYDPLADEIALPEGKIGVKKRAKLEAKAEKRNARERELEEREERKQRQEQLEETRKKEEEKQKEEEAQRLEEEKRLKEEKEKKELEEYLQMKAAFTVEEEGHDEEEDDPQNQNKLQQFIEYIQKEKVVQLEDLAGHFQMKTQDVIDRVQSLLEQEVLVGVIDDRGKFICITKEELQSVAKFIRQRGRVAISDLVESSNQLINLQPVA